MVEQYPDSIAITVTTAATQNSSGVWTAGTATVYALDCRGEENKRAGKIVGADGVLLDYAYACYLPLMTTVIPYDSACILTLENNATVTGKVKGAKNGQLNSRIWL